MNQSLRSELLAMRAKDISTRTILVEKGELAENEYHPVMKSVHEENNKRIKQVTEKPDEVNKRRKLLGMWSQEEHTVSLQEEYDTIQINKEKQDA